MKQLSSVVVVMAVCGCGGLHADGADEFRNGVPASGAVELKVPGATQQPLTGEGTKRDGLEGDTAAFYGFTRGVTVLVNTGVAATLVLVEKITEYPPTATTATSATWGPHTDALSPNTWKMTVTQVEKDVYSYSLVGKGKNEPDSAFRVILSGTHHSTGAKIGSGDFLIDWDQAQQLPEHDQNVGTAKVTYSKVSASANVTVDALFTNVRDGDNGKLISSKYKYTEQPGNGGSLEFSANKDFYGAAKIEQLDVRSRWQQTGAGRADVKVSQGDLETAATITECWDTNFASRYLLASYQTTGNYGAASVCTFSSAEYATP